jgi:uncharacterized protein YfbU (UPF0304 family)
MIEKTERFEMRLDPEMIGLIDHWRNNQKSTPTPSRAEAIRRLVEKGIRADFTKGETLITHMLCDLHKHLKIKGGVNPDLVESALVRGHYWALEWEYPGIFHDHSVDKETVSEVVDILDMWTFIERAYGKFSSKEKEEIKKGTDHFGNHVLFNGFDGNNESEHFSITLFLVNDIERFTNFKGRELNSHMEKVGIYKKMLRVFKPIRTTLVGRELSVPEMINILKR